MEVERPRLKEDGIVIKMEACGICGSDLHFYKLGLWANELGRPVDKGLIPGHEFSGQIVEAGEKVTGLKVGDRVMAITMGAMAEYVRVGRAVAGVNVFRLAPEVSYEEAATLEPLATSLHAAKLGSPAHGDTVVVFGAGIIGLGIVQSLKALGVNLERIIAVDVSDRRLEMAGRIGATHLINALKEDPYGKIATLVRRVRHRYFPKHSSLSVDIVYDAVGYIKEYPENPVIGQAVSLAREEGRVVVTGAFEGPVTVDFSPLMLKEVKVLGAFGYRSDEVLQALEFIRTGKVDRKMLISHEFPLDRAKEAFETQIRSDKSIKVLIKPYL